MVEPELLALKKRKRRRDDELDEAEAEMRKKNLSNSSHSLPSDFLHH